jgi:hypothetical protein
VSTIGLLNIVPLLLGIFAAQPEAMGQTVTRLIIQDEVILRVPVQPRPLIPQIEWVEKKGPRCIPAGAIQRALLSGPNQVDFIMVNHSRMRAHLEENCPALDFYAGFYLQPPDERLCAGRDAVRSRIGGSCSIEHFKRLMPTIKR